MSAPSQASPLRAVLMAWALLASASACATPALVIDNVTVVDVRAGKLSGPRQVVVESAAIAAIRNPTNRRMPVAALHVDGHGAFLIPGLVDLHVHLFNNASHRPPNDWMFALFVVNGVTGVREMMTTVDELPQVSRWRHAVEAGNLVAPRVLAAGVAVNGSGANEVRERVREAAHAGADFIKVFSDVGAPQWRAIIDEARRQHIRVSGHVPAGVPLLEAARAGQVTAEHLLQVYEACSSLETTALDARRGLDGAAAAALSERQERAVLDAFDPAACKSAAQALAATRQAQVPTLVLNHNEAAGRVDTVADPRWRYLRNDEQARWRRVLDAVTPADTTLGRLREDISCRVVRILHAAGVTVLAGTDSPMPRGYPGYALHDELELLAGCGLSSAQVLRAATLGATELLGIEASSGTVEVGKRADLVLLDANPLADVRNLRRIRAVVLGGRLLTGSDLARLIDEQP
jgi:cytosine/adenosine deaminase-related metal-dependent hydrolase